MSSAAPDHAWVTSAGDRFALRYVDGVARVEGTDLRRVARDVGTPTYVYGSRHIADRYRALADAVGRRPTLICYAVKANSNQAILRLLGRLGAGADIVSGGELERVLAAGIEPGKIVFSGVGKSDAEIDAALRAGVKAINVESPGELDRVGARAAAAGRRARVALRVNPDVDPDTHPYLATGLRESKFGIAMRDALDVSLRAHEHPSLDLVGIACHIGSQIMDATPFLDSLTRLRGLLSALADRGIALEHLDLGGGLGIAYGRDDRQLDVASWGGALAEATADLPLQLVLEPGRYLVGNAGVLLTRVLQRKQGEDRSFVIVDAAMNDLLRPALYQAYHAVVPVELPPADAPVEVVDVVGPVCESGDFLARDRPLASVTEGQLLAVLSAGAYGMTMSSTYNTRPLAAEVLVEDDRYAVVRPRKTVADLIAEDVAEPDWR